MTINKKSIFIPLLLLIFVAVGASVVYILKLDFLVKPEVGECDVNAEEKIVKGDSLSGLVEDGQTVRVIFGYYDCHEIKREDVVLYSYAGNEDPLIKIAKGIPGDKFNLQKTEDGWHILVNDEILKNSKNESYLLDERGYKMLYLYERDYQGIIPEQAYLIMGNLTSGTTDSSRYGLVHKSNILGKAEVIKK